MIKIKKTDCCDLCKKNEVEYVYTPKNSKRLLKVFICTNCGLVQSFPKIDHVKDRPIKASGDADWGNIRYGKSFRTKHNLNMINEVKEISSFTRCLDIGSNRGNFLIDIKKLNNDLEIWGVEPDSNIFESYSKLESFKIINERIENVDLPDNYFDLVYCSHTIEHLKSPLNSLIKIRSILKDNGIAYLEVPNIETINFEDTIEEFFIDKHLYHFSIKTFTNLIERAGLKILSSSTSKQDKSNISMVVGKKPTLNEMLKISDYKNNKKLIVKYSETRKSNITHQKNLAEKLNNIAKQKRLVVWGAGRIFDILVRVGGLNTSTLSGVIDKHISEFISHAHGREILNSNMLNSLDPEVIFIASREHYDEIYDEILDINESIEVLGFSTEIMISRNG